jgi:hypothetical protein
MYNFTLKFHSGIAYLVLLGLVLIVLYAIIGLLSGKKFGRIEKITSTVTMSLLHLQAIAGIVLFFVSPNIKGSLAHIGEAMGNAAERYFLLEHPLMMLLAIAVFTIGRKKFLKAETDKSTYTKMLIFGSLTLLIVASRVPWDRLFA